MDLPNHLGRIIDISISGGHCYQGLLIDFGDNIAIIYDGHKYFYISLAHVHSIDLIPENDSEISSYTQMAPINASTKNITFKKIMETAKGLLIEILVSGKNLLNGYIDNIYEDFFLFNSPAYKTMIIPTKHLKAIALTSYNQTFYTLGKKDIPYHSFLCNTAISTFARQLHNLQGSFVIFDLGIDPNKTGFLRKTENGFAELVIANGHTVFINLRHIKTVHLP